MKKIVIISYATYPGNSPRNLRTNELSKELAKKGHDVTLYVLTGGYNYELYEKQTNIKIKPLGRTYFFNFTHGRGTVLNIFMKVLRKFIGRIFEFPSIELAFNTYRALKKEDKIDLLITIAVPYSLHWGAALFKTIHKKNLVSTVWVADCGDPYMGNSFHKKPFYFEYIEKWFCEKVDFISIPLEDAREAYYPEFHKKIRIIPQGFNFDEVEINTDKINNSVITFIYAGVFYQNLRDPRPFLDYLLTLDQEFKFIIYTKTPNLLSDYVGKLGSKLQVFNYIPRKELIFKMSNADFLINLENPSKQQSPSKLIDYALSGSPILSINTNDIIDVDLIKQFLSKNYSGKLIIKDIQNYNIENVANEFLRLSK